MKTLLLSVMLGTPLPDMKAAELPSESAKRIGAACFRIANVETGNEGLGFIVGARGKVLYGMTAAHVVTGRGSWTIKCRTPQGTNVELKDVEVLARQVTLDIAVVRMTAGDLAVTPLRFAIGDSIGQDEPFDAVSIAIGDNGEPVVGSERVLGKKLLRRRDGLSSFVWESRDRPDPGRSGGPLLNTAGQVIGVVIGAQEGRGYHCHRDEIRAFLKKRDLGWLIDATAEK